LAYDLEKPPKLKINFMKKAIFTLVLLVVTTIAVAQPGSVLNLSVYGNSLFTVQLDQQYYSLPDRLYSFREIQPGSHFIRIFRQTFLFHHVQQKEIFSGYVHVPYNTIMNVFVDRMNRLKVTGMQPIYSQNYFETNHQCENTCYSEAIIPDQQIIPCNTVMNNYMPAKMPEMELNNLKSIIGSKSFDSTRLTISKQAVSSSYLSTTQVKQLLSLLTFESSRLELAKAAFDRTVDRQNYYLTYTSFSFDSSVNELIRYIQSQS
jgi:hypothetical protein